VNIIGGERQQSLKGAEGGASALPFSQKTKRKRIHKRKRKSAKPFDYKTISK